MAPIDSPDNQDAHGNKDDNEEVVLITMRKASQIQSAPSTSGNEGNISVLEQMSTISIEKLEPDELLAKLSLLRNSVEERLVTSTTIRESLAQNILGDLSIHVNEGKSSIDPSFCSQNSEKLYIPASIKKTIENESPETLAKLLYKEDQPAFTPFIICSIIGANDEFHKRALIAYMDYFDFSGISLDEAFRRFCLHVQLSGETQAIDRILYQLSLRYWNCNPAMMAFYKSVDIVYGTLFSIVLLNTDLHSASVSSKSHKKISLRVFIKNTMALFDDMIDKDLEISSLVGTSPEELKNWKKGFEVILKDIYTSILENPILKKSSNPSTQYQNSTTTSISSASQQKPDGIVNSRLNLNSAPKSFGASFSFLKKDNSKPLHPNTNQIVIEGILIRKHLIADGGERASNRRWIKLWSCIRISKDMGVELHTHRVSHANGNDKEFIESEHNTPIQYSDTLKYPASASGGSLPSTPSVPPLIDNQQASPIDYHQGPNEATALHISIGKKFNGSAYDNETPHSTFESNTSASSVSPQTSNQGSNIRIPSHPVLSPPGEEYRLSSSNEDEVMSLIHSFSASYHYDGPGREHCFSIKFSNNHVYLFQCPTQMAQQAWIKTINYWAAIKSKEPMRGGISNQDYGWSLLKDNSGQDLASLAITEHEENQNCGQSIDQESSKSIGASTPIMSGMKKTGPLSLQKSDSSRSFRLKRDNSFNSLNQNPSNSIYPFFRPGKSVKLAKWIPDIVSTRLVSNKDEIEQLQCMVRQLEYVRGEIAAHEDLKQNLDNYFASHPQFSLILLNWNTKYDALNHEYLKYESYIDSLRSVIEFDQASTT